MNKIYKVIWSKVKHQYVVVSELAHSNGKQSRTSRNSIRSRIAALVVCGAIAAFGVFSAVPNSAFAEVAGGEATQSQYIAIAIEGNPGEGNNDATWHKGSWPFQGYWELNDEKKYGDYTYVRQTVTVGNSEKQYWVRKGYDITAIQGERHESINDNTDYIIDAKKNAQYDASSDQGLLQAYQTTTSEGKITTLTGVNIEKLDTGVYGGASNTSGVTTPSTFGYHIKVGGAEAASDGYIRVTGDPKSSNPNFSTYFSHDINLENNGSYSYINSNGEKVIVPDNKIYSIDGKLGVFTDAKGNLYTGDVYGDNNEILLSGSDGNKIYSYWGTKINDLSQTIGNMTLQEYNQDRKKLQDQAAAYHGDDITNIAVGGANNNGTISLNRVGIYDEQTGDYTSTTPVPGTITVTSTGGTDGSGANNDVKIKFSNTDEDGTEHSFTVDAGSKVVANNGAGGTDLETISVNGQTFNVIGGAISGQIDSEGNVKIQQGNKEPVTIGKVSDWNVKSGQINGSTLTLTTENAYDGNPKTGTVTIDGVASTNYVDGKDALNVKYDSAEKTSVTLGGKTGTPVKLTNVANGTTTYDAVNFSQLEAVQNAENYVTSGSINNENGTITLNRVQGGDVTIEGLSQYVANKDEYATSAELNGSELTINRHLGEAIKVDLSQLTSGLSGTDYQVVANPVEGSDGVYSVSADGTLKLTVKDLNNPEAEAKEVSISGIAQKDYVDAKDALNVKYDSVDKTSVTLGGKGSKTPVKLTNVAAGELSATSTDAVNGSQLYATNQKVDAGWVATDGTNKIEVNPTDSGTTTLNFAGDNNITVTADTTNKAIQVALNDKVYLGGDHTEDSRNIVLDGERGVIGLGSTIALDGRDGTAVIGGVNITTTAEEGTGKLVSTINGLSNTTWTGTTETPNRAATEGQLQSVATEAAKHTTVSGDENITVKHEEGSQDYQVTLNPDVTLKGDNSSIELNGTKGTMQVNQETTEGTDFTNINGNVVSIGYTNKEGTKNAIVIDGGEGTITGLSNTTWDGSTNDISRAATEGQLKAVSDTVNAGWIATDNSGKEVAVNPDNNKLKFAGDDNITVSATTDENNNNAINVKLNDNITLGNGQSAITLNGSPENSNDPALSVGTDKFVVDQDGSLSVSDKFNVDAETGNVNAINNSGSAIMMNDDSVALNAGGNGIAISDEGILLNTNGINEDIKLVTKGTSVSVDSNGTTFTNTNTNETTNIDGGTINVGDKLVVDQDGTTTIAVNDGTVMGNNTTMTVNKDGVAFSAYGNGTTVIDGQTIYAGGVVINNNGSGTINGLTNTTWDDELAKQVANSEELQGTAATQGQLQQAVSEVAEVANAGWNAKAGGNTINVKPNETLNFEGDGNITVSATGGTSNELKFGLNDDITLGNPKAGNTEGERSFTINTTNPEGYVPESYKTGSGADFIDENGGFMLFATNTQGYGVFGVTAKGSAWAKDFKTYTTDIYGNNIQYSLNDVGDAVAQMSSYYNKENGKSYTVFSRYLNEAEKDNPFATVDENATRDIPLALRDDGAVLIGATIKGDDFTDNGIRINAETETTYDGDGNEVTNNIATITGLENTEWKPPTPVATFAANDINTTSRAATEAQLDDLYSAVAAYDVNVDGTIDYSHIALAGAPYGASRAGNGTPTGGTSITNVAYASGKDGSEAVNVDYLNDAISDAAENGSISTSDQHLVANTETGSNGVYKPNDDGNVNLIVSDEKGNSSTITIGDVASKEDLDNLKDDVGDLDYSKVEGDTIIDGDSVTDAIGKLDNKIENISGTATDADNNTVTGGKINSDGTISLTQKDKDSIKLEGQLTDSGVVQEGTSFDKETGTITITSQDKYSGETSSVKVEGIASTEVVGATNKEDLATAYKDADKDGNATTEYITDSESMVEADVALDHAIQDVANTSYANDMVLSNRIDSVEKRLGNVEERIDKVGAMAAAIANLRTMGFDPEAPTEIAIGVGQYKSETGIAIGVFHYPNQDFMLSASLSSSGDELMGGIGATWKLGRKSAAERAKDEEARHLEQAEEMKKLAQQEKVKAQAQRHAKLLAERQQASQKNA